MRSRTIVELTVHSDPSHGWLECPRSLAVELGIISRISHFSYQLGCLIFLECDRDAGLAIEALKAQSIPYEVRPVYYSEFCDIPKLRPFGAAIEDLK